MRRSGSAGAVSRGRMRAAASLPHIARARAEEGGGAGRRSPCLLVALRPRNVEAERERFFRERFAYDPQFEYAEPVPEAVLEKYRDASDRFVAQAIRIIHAVLEKYGTYESFEVATGGRLLSKCQIWSVIRKYMQKEGCAGEAAGSEAVLVLFWLRAEVMLLELRRLLTIFHGFPSCSQFALKKPLTSGATKSDKTARCCPSQPSSVC